jgi:hypothetical protein
VVVAVIVGLLVLLNGQENTLVTGAANSTATADAPHTPVAVVAYQNTFASSADGWTSDAHCSLASGGYLVSGAGCIGPIGDLQDVDIKVTVEEVAGSTVAGYGIILRHVGTDVRYDVLIDGDSQWAAFRCDGVLSSNTADCHDLVNYTANAAIHGGLNVANTIEGVAKGSHFAVSINGVSVGSFDDSTYSHGGVGFISNSTADAVFTDLVVTRLD